MGICGDFNNVPTDDFKTSGGTFAPNATAFAASWASTERKECGTHLVPITGGGACAMDAEYE